MENKKKIIIAICLVIAILVTTVGGVFIYKNKPTPGNNGEDKTEGVRYKNVFGTYSHGPVLPKNPELCDFILKTALEHKYGKCQLSSLDDDAEHRAHAAIARKMMY